MKRWIVALLLLVPVVTLAKIDSRLATARKAFVIADDDLGDDRTVAACVADRLQRETPIVSVATKEEAEIVLRIKAHITSGVSRALLGGMGGSPSAHITAELPDGTRLWDDGAKARYQGTGFIGATKDESSLACSLADRLLSTLRDAMRKARGKK